MFGETNSRNNPMNDEKPWSDEQTLHRLYHKKNLSQREIADRLGCSRKTIGNWMDKLNIETRTLSEAHTVRHDGVRLQVTDDGYVVWRNVWEGVERRVPVHRLLAVAENGYESVIGEDAHHLNHIPWDNRPSNITLEDPKDHGRMHAEKYQNGVEAPWRDEDTLRELYLEENMNVKEVADELGCSMSCASRWLREHGIDKPWRDKKTLEKLRKSEGLTYKEMGERLGCTKSNAEKWTKRLGVEV